MSAERRYWRNNRHTLVTELAEPGSGDEAIMSIAGHVSRASAPPTRSARRTPSGGSRLRQNPCRSWFTVTELAESDAGDERQVSTCQPPLAPYLIATVTGALDAPAAVTTTGTLDPVATPDGTIAFT